LQVIDQFSGVGVLPFCTRLANSCKAKTDTVSGVGIVMRVTPKRAAVAAFLSALIPPAFLGAGLVMPMGEWFEVVFVGAPMLLIPSMVLQRREDGDTVGLRLAVLAAYAGLVGFLMTLALLPLYAMGAVPESTFVWTLTITLMTGLGVLLSCLSTRSLPRVLALLGLIAAATWMTTLGAELLQMAAAPWLGTVWLLTHGAFGLGLLFRLYR